MAKKAMIEREKKRARLVNRYAAKRAELKEIAKDEYLVSALTPIETFNEKFDSDLSDKDFDTVGGIVMHHFARFPKPNDAINIDNLRFVINSLERRRIKRIKVSKIT